jgi:signal peptidase I
MEKKRSHPKEPWLAVVLSSFLAGIGQIYSGRIWRGSLLILTEGMLVCLSIWSLLSPKCDILVTAGLCLVLIAIGIWNLFDAHKCAKRINPEDFEIERRLSKDPWLALFLSDLIPGLGQIYLKRWLLGIGFLISAGILLIVDVKYPLLYVSLCAFFSMFVCYHAYISAPIRREPSNKTVSIIVIVILCSYLFYGYSRHAFRAYVVGSFQIPVNVLLPPEISANSAMKPTLVPGDRLLVRKTKKYNPKRGDVIVFSPPDDPSIPLVKRIAALPSETLEIKDEALYIDGQQIQHPALQDIEYPPRDFLGMEKKPYEVPENHIFVIGDNSVNSLDSRAFGAIPLSNVVGKAYKIYWPLFRRGPIQ